MRLVARQNRAGLGDLGADRAAVEGEHHLPGLDPVALGDAADALDLAVDPGLDRIEATAWVVPTRSSTTGTLAARAATTRTGAAGRFGASGLAASAAGLAGSAARAETVGGKTGETPTRRAQA